ncbi:MAG: YbaN family protein [candidate division WOR-3 bacterium]
MRVLYIFLGIFFVLLGIIGAILPVMPSTVFFIIAAYFFARSSKTLYNLLLSIPYVGEQIKIWEKYKAVPKRVKRIALTFSILGVLGGLFMAFISGNIIAIFLVIIVGIPLIWMVLRLRVLEGGNTPL